MPYQRDFHIRCYINNISTKNVNNVYIYSNKYFAKV